MKSWRSQQLIKLILACFFLHISRLVPINFVIASSEGRNLESLPKWAEENGIGIHPNVQWKRNGENDWGLELSASLPRGTVLLRVPRSLVLDSAVIKSKFEANNPTISEKIRQALMPFQAHEENFWILVELFKCRKSGPSNLWYPWLAAMPQKFVEFSKDEQECLPFFAKYIADYQDQKFEAFCTAARVLGELENDTDKREFKWAFQAVNSRFWKTASIHPSDTAERSEMVPVGDMFNHRDPPNVRVVPLKKEEGEYVAFVYLGDDDPVFPKDLYITYGQPSNPHRFLVIFGFVPTDTMKELWSHLMLGDSNPLARDMAKMVFGCRDGAIPPQVWDAVLYELEQPQGGLHDNDHDKGMENNRQWYAAEFLHSHVNSQLEELSDLRQKMDTLQTVNLPLLRQHNDFLTRVFGKVKANLNDILAKEE